MPKLDPKNPTPYRVESIAMRDSLIPQLRGIGGDNKTLAKAIGVLPGNLTRWMSFEQLPTRPMLERIASFLSRKAQDERKAKTEAAAARKGEQLELPTTLIQVPHMAAPQSALHRQAAVDIGAFAGALRALVSDDGEHAQVRRSLLSKIEESAKVIA